jgi:A/G-specific adenine glycosylase
VVIRDDGCVLLRTRPREGLLGGMTEVPSTAWSEDFEEGDALADAPRLSRVRPRWRRLPGVVHHGFTHFPLEQTVYIATVPARTTAPAGAHWTPVAELAGEALPNVMRKVLAHALEASALSRSSPRKRGPGHQLQGGKSQGGNRKSGFPLSRE